LYISWNIAFFLNLKHEVDECLNCTLISKCTTMLKSEIWYNHPEEEKEKDFRELKQKDMA